MKPQPFKMQRFAGVQSKVSMSGQPVVREARWQLLRCPLSSWLWLQRVVETKQEFLRRADAEFVPPKEPYQKYDASCLLLLLPPSAHGYAAGSACAPSLLCRLPPSCLRGCVHCSCVCLSSSTLLAGRRPSLSQLAISSRRTRWLPFAMSLRVRVASGRPRAARASSGAAAAAARACRWAVMRVRARARGPARLPAARRAQRR